MPTISTELAFQIRQNGAQELSQSLVGIKGEIEGVTDATVKHGKASSALTQFIKEERTEHRQRAFLFRESRDAILLASSAMMLFNNSNDNASETQKKLGKSLSESVGAMFAADFAIKGLGIATGGTATAMAGVIGLGAGLIGFFSNTNDAAKKAAEEGMAHFTDALNKMSTSRIGMSEDVVNRKLAALN